MRFSKRSSRSIAAVVVGCAAAATAGCSTLLGLDRFDGASVALDTEAGGEMEGATGLDSASTGSNAADAAADGADDRGVGTSEAANDGEDGTVLDGAPPDGPAPDAQDAGLDVDGHGDASAADANGDSADGAPADGGGATADAGDGSLADAGDSGDASRPPLYTFTFDADTQGWASLFTSIPDAGLQDCPLTYSATEGDPSPGSLELKAPYNGPNQGVNIGLYFPGGVDMSGRTVTMVVKLASGLSSDINNLGVAMPFMQDTSYDWADNGGTYLTDTGLGDGGWVTLRMKVDRPAGYVAQSFTPQSILLLGLQIGTRGCGSPNACAPADVFIDSIIVQ